MPEINYIQIFLFLIECVLISALLLFLFKIRSFTGMGLLYAALGLFQYMQVFLAVTVYFEIADGLFVSPGSTVLFTSSLFIVLLVYIKDDANETRKIIYALLVVNIVMSILLWLFSWNIKSSDVFNPYHISTDFLKNNARVLFVGTITLFLDSVLVIFLYEFFSKFIKSLFFKILFTMSFVLSFDSLLFSSGAFLGTDYFKQIMISGLISKNASVFIYSIIFALYLKYIDKEVIIIGKNKFKDIFHTLTYRQKYELAKKEKEIVRKETEKMLQLSEIKYNTLANISPVGIFFTRPDGFTVYVNPKWCEISGMTQEKALAYGWLEAVHPDDRPLIGNDWDKAVNKKSVSYAEYRFLKTDGSCSWVLGQAVPELNEAGEIIGYVGTITDITDLKLYESELNIAKEKAEESDRLKSAFLANISHEIRTPMNGILGFADLLKNTELPQNQLREYLNLIEISSKRMLNIINDIVEISLIDSGQVVIDNVLFNIKDQIIYLIDTFKEEASQKQIKLFLNQTESNNGLTIFSDKEKFKIILSKLIKNALKYTDKGSIEIGFNHMDINQLKHIECYVKDTGIGIPKDRQKAVYDRFVQADIADSKAYQGAGLGLSITKAYVELLGGDIRFTSNEKKGSEFYFTIPLKNGLDANSFSYS